MPIVNKTLFSSIPVPVPPLEEQKSLVRFLRQKLSQQSKMERLGTLAKVHVDKLTQSILAKAFRGELVPQDPNDEPASVLLERIRQERNGASITKAKPTRKKSGKMSLPVAKNAMRRAVEALYHRPLNTKEKDIEFGNSLTRAARTATEKLTVPCVMATWII
jgi:restriction endonuclease S subunit